MTILIRFFTHLWRLYILNTLKIEELEDEGQNIRKAYQRRLPSDNSKDYYFIHRNTGNTEPLIIEYGFIDKQGNVVIGNFEN